MAAILNRSDERDQLKLKLNNGDKTGFNYDEAVVVVLTSEPAVRRLFPRTADIRDITSFVLDVRLHINSMDPPNRLKMEALIRGSLGDENVDISDIKSDELMLIHGIILAGVAKRLGFGKADILQLILEGERKAFELGWKPPLAS